MGEAYNCVVSICLKFQILSILRKIHHGSHARTGQGYFPKRPSLQTLSAYLAEAEFGGRQGADLQIGQKRFDALANRRHPSRFPRRRSGEIRHRHESASNPEGEGTGVGNSRGSISYDQEGRLHQKAFGEEPQGSRCEIPAYSDRVANPPSRSLLQDQARLAAHLEVRVLHRLRPGRLRTTTIASTITTTTV